MTKQADALVERVRAERALDRDQRPTRAHDASLDAAIDLLERISRRLDEGAEVRRPAEELGRLVSDSWDWTAELTSAVLAYKQALGRVR